MTDIEKAYFIDCLQTADWGFQYADDYSAFCRGCDSVRRAHEEKNRLKRKYPDSKEVEDIWQKYKK